MRRFEHLMFLVVPILLILAAASASLGPSPAATGSSTPSSVRLMAPVVAAVVRGR